MDITERHITGGWTAVSFSTDSQFAPGALLTLTSDLNLEGVLVGVSIKKELLLVDQIRHILSYCSYRVLLVSPQSWLQ